MDCQTQGRLKLMIELYISEIINNLIGAPSYFFAGSANLTTSPQSTSITFRLYVQRKKFLFGQKYKKQSYFS
jgi:hypothetical protein